jgi:hypothetical protein
VLDGNPPRHGARFQGVEWIDADVTAFRAPSGTPSPLEPTRPRTIEETKELTMPNKPPGREDPKEREGAADEEAIAKLLELNGMHRALAFEEGFLLGERGGKVPAALRCSTEPKRLVPGLLICDPWVDVRLLVVALYAGVGELAREMGVREVLVSLVLHADDYRYEAGYRWQYPGGWYLDAAPPPSQRVARGRLAEDSRATERPRGTVLYAFRRARQWIDGSR